MNDPPKSPQRDEAVRKEPVASPQDRLALLADAAVSTLIDGGARCIHLLFIRICVICSFLNVCRRLWTRGTHSPLGKPAQITGLLEVSLHLPR